MTWPEQRTEDKTASPTPGPALLAPSPALAPETCRRAALTVARYSTDAGDARELLEMLGLLEHT